MRELNLYKAMISFIFSLLFISHLYISLFIIPLTLIMWFSFRRISSAYQGKYAQARNNAISGRRCEIDLECTINTLGRR